MQPGPLEPFLLSAAVFASVSDRAAVGGKGLLSEARERCPVTGRRGQTVRRAPGLSCSVVLLPVAAPHPVPFPLRSLLAPLLLLFPILSSPPFPPPFLPHLLFSRSQLFLTYLLSRCYMPGSPEGLGVHLVNKTKSALGR